MDHKKAIEFVIHLEGGYVNDPLDPGGETKYGISKKSFPDIDIKNLTYGHAVELYRMHYWMKLKCDGMPSMIRLPLFDCGVNQGVYSASYMLQKSIILQDRKINVDGIIGPKTIDAVNSLDDSEMGYLLADFMKMRVKKYFNLKTFDRFGNGWINRLVDVLCYNSHG